MPRFTRRAAAAVVAAVLIAISSPARAGTGGDDADDDRSTRPVVAVQGRSDDEVADLTFDDRLAAIASEVPEFGGLHVDEAADSTIVNVTARRPGLVGDLRRAINRQFPSASLPRRIRLDDSPFSFTQLHNWKTRGVDVMAIEDVVSLDIDEQTGLLTIGVSQEGSEDEIADELAANDIPPEGWTIETVGPSVDASNIVDRHRPVMGGLQVEKSSGGRCTYGLTAYRNGVLGFITNSHCTNAKGGTEGSILAQPTYDPSGANNIGVEAVDPQYFNSTLDARCTVGFVCRYSDSAFFRGVSGVTYSRAVSAGLLTRWDGSSRYYVVDEDTAFVGMLVSKLGRTTGLTSGKVTETCASKASGILDSAGRKVIYLCQTKTDMLVDGGDSGSPVFRLVPCQTNATTNGCAAVYGLIWTHDSVGGIFSPIGQIQRSTELGLVYTCVNDSC